MKVLLRTVATELAPGEGTGIDHCAYDKLVQCAAVDRFGVHRLTDDPEDADLILFAELGFTAAMGVLDSRLRRHPLVRRYPDKCFVVNSADTVVTSLPGVYPSVERSWYDARRVRSGHYLSTHYVVPPHRTRPHAERDLLFSFLGTAENHPVRRRIVQMRHPRGLCRDVSAESRRVWAAGGEAVRGHLEAYAEVMSRSRFALCPRGLGTSSIRLFESMRFGVAPVIVSDDWVPPTGPDWSSFSLRVPEARVGSLPGILEESEPRSEEMGRLARRAWEDWFSDEVTFHRVVEWCREIVEARGAGGDPLLGRLRGYRQLLQPVHVRGVLRELYRRSRRAA